MNPESFKFSLERIKARCRLTLLSVKGTQIPDALNWNKGKFAPLGVMAKRFVRAMTGQILEFWMRE